MKPSQLIRILPKLLRAKRVPVISSHPGVGKSSISQQVSRNMGVGFQDIRLAYYDPTALAGFPTEGVASDGAPVMKFVPMDLLPRSGSGILLLDEIFQASPATQAATYQLMLDRKVNSYELPDGWSVMAAGNFAENGGVYNEFPEALDNRVIHITLDPDQPEWDIWAKSKGINAIVRAFLRTKPSLLVDRGARAGGGKAFPSPRSWEAAGSVIDLNFSAGEEAEILEGTIGKGATVELIAFKEVADDLPTIEDILARPDTARIPRSPAAKHVITMLLEDRSTAQNIGSVLEYLGRLEVEFQTAYMSGVTLKNPDVCNASAYVKWCMANKAMLGIN